MPKERPSIERAQEVASKAKQAIDSAKEAESAIDRNTKKVTDLANQHQKKAEAVKRGLDAVGVDSEQLGDAENTLRMGFISLLDLESLSIDKGNKIKADTGQRLNNLSISVGTEDDPFQAEAGVNREGFYAEGTVKKGPVNISAKTDGRQAHATANFDRKSLNAQVQVDNQGVRGEATARQGPLKAKIEADKEGVAGQVILNKESFNAELLADKKGLRGKANIERGGFSGGVEVDQKGARGQFAAESKRLKVKGEADSNDLKNSGFEMEVKVLDGDRIQLTLTGGVQEGTIKTRAKAQAEPFKYLPIITTLQISNLGPNPEKTILRAAAGLNLKKISITGTANIPGKGGDQSYSINIEGKFRGRGQK